MSTGVFDDLQSALGETDPSNVSDFSYTSATRPYVFADDWEVSSVDSLTQNTSGPYCEGESIEVEMNFSGSGQSFARCRDREANYTTNTSQNCTVAGSTPPTFTFTVDSGAGGTSNNTIGITFSNAFNDATGEGSEFQTTFDVSDYQVNITGTTYDSSNDDVDVDYEICCGQTDYYVDLYRDVDATEELAAEDSKGSANCGGTSYTITDTNPHSSDSSDDYRLEVTDADDGGTTVSDTVTQNFPT